MDPRDGSRELEQTLTELMKAMTGLVGKSVYLILKMKNEARFLGDWYGDQEKEIVLQVKLLFNGPTLASFLFIFGLFNQMIRFLQQMNVKNVHYPALGFKIITSYESPPISTRPGLPIVETR